MNDARYLAPDAFGTLPDHLQHWASAHPRGGVVILLPEAEQARLPALQGACRAAHLPLIGAIFPELIANQTFIAEGAWLLCFDPMPPWFLLEDGDGTSPDLQTSLLQAIHAARPEAASATEPGNLFLIFDSMLPTIGSLMLDMYEHLGRTVRYGGINAGSETFQPMPCLFDAHRCIGNGVLGLFLPPQQQVIARHAYPVSKGVMRANSTRGNCIDQIDGRPAFEAYSEIILAEYGVRVTNENFYQYAAHFPFGLVNTLDVLVRIPVALTPEGALHCVGEIPPNSMLRLLRAPALDESTCVDVLAAALAPTATLGAQPMLTFYCAGRRMHFGAEMASRELAELAQRTSPAGLMGALTLGEIDCDDDLGMPRFHNATVVCVR